jgi:hypothetical protein
MRARMGLSFQRFVVIFAAAFVIFVGFATLLGLIFGNFSYTVPENSPIFAGAAGSIPTDVFAVIFVRIAVITLALALLVGISNLLFVNAHRIVKGQTYFARLNSVIVLASFVIGLIVPVLAARESIPAEWNSLLLENVQTSIESALAALLFFTLVYGAFRIMRHRLSLAKMLFVLTVEIVLIGALPLSNFAPLRQFTDWLINVPVNAGARGILLGIALATLLTGLRVLIGQDRSYGE